MARGRKNGYSSLTGAQVENDRFLKKRGRTLKEVGNDGNFSGQGQGQIGCVAAIL